jgi:hypothetical protein
MRSDSVYLNILEMYLCLFLPSKYFSTQQIGLVVFCI